MNNKKSTIELILELEKMQPPLFFHNNHRDIVEYVAKTYQRNVSELKINGLPDMASHYQKWFDNYAKQQHDQFGYWLEGNTIHKKVK